MKKRSKILASLVLAGTMVLGLAGCGDSGSANGGTQSVRTQMPNIGRYLPARTARGSRCRYKGL